MTADCESVYEIGLGAARLAAEAGAPVTVDHEVLGRVVSQPYEGSGVVDSLVIHTPVNGEPTDITRGVVEWGAQQFAQRIAQAVVAIHVVPDDDDGELYPAESIDPRYLL